MVYGKRPKIKNNRVNFRGQSLLELLLSIGVGTILIGGSVLLMATSLKSYQSIKQRLTINSLSRQEAEVIISKAQDSWHSVYDLTRATNYYATSTNNVWSFNSGKEESTINNVFYRRYFQVLDALRDDSGNIATSGNTDPNTLKINVFLEYGINYNSSSTLSFYLTRSANNQVLQQTDWSGGPGQTGPIPNSGNKFDTSTNIDYASTTGSIYMATTTAGAELISSIIDTGIEGGAGFNSLLWQGSKGTNGSVKFQIAFSNSATGPWTYYGCTTIPSSCLNPNNWTTASSSLAALEPNTSLPLPFYGTPSPQNNRYIRYKVFLSTSGTSPQINDIIINWSP
ncbi:MAG TPA: hypothetical protein PK418_01860 [Candidatus Paceibacterota bacterium]|nr:hypothetical protein [Candidatus Paceibacterota bacterium]